jgi:hypothetical protein
LTPRLTFRAVTWAISRSTQSLKLVFLERVAPAQAALLDVDRIGGGVLFGPIPRDEAGAAVSAVNLKTCDRGRASVARIAEVAAVAGIAQSQPKALPSLSPLARP